MILKIKFRNMFLVVFCTNMLFTYHVKFSVGLFLPAFVRPMLDTYRTAEQPPQPALSDVSVSFGSNFLVLFQKQIICMNF